MVERKRISGDEASRYIGVARNLLAQLKQSMQLNKLMVLSRTVDVGDGVRVAVASVFGQDTITIHAPPAVEAAIAQQAALENAAQYRLPEAQREVEVTVVSLQYSDTVQVGESISVRFTDTDAGASTLRIYIAGRRNGRAVVLANGVFATLGQRSTNERNGRVYAFSDDGAVAIGAVEAYIPALDAFSQQPIGWKLRAAIWTGDFTGVPNVVRHDAPEMVTASYAFARAGAVYHLEMAENSGDGRASGDWNGTNGAAYQYVADRPATPMTTTSRDGRVTASGNTYRVDGGASLQWVSAGGVADCVHTTLVSSSGRDYISGAFR